MLISSQLFLTMSFILNSMNNYELLNLLIVLWTLYPAMDCTLYTFVILSSYPQYGTLTTPLLYKPEGYRFDPSWCHWYFPLTQSFRLHYGTGVDSASNRNEYQQYFLGVNVAGV